MKWRNCFSLFFSGQEKVFEVKNIWSKIEKSHDTVSLSLTFQALTAFYQKNSFPCQIDDLNIANCNINKGHEEHWCISGLKHWKTSSFHIKKHVFVCSSPPLYKCSFKKKIWEICVCTLNPRAAML